MGSIAELVTPYLLKLITDEVAKVLPWLVQHAPKFLEGLLKELLESKEVVDWLAKVEQQGSAAIVHLAETEAEELEALAKAFLAKHPLLAKFFGEVQASPVAAAALKLGADEVKALLAKQSGGSWAEVRAFLGL